MIVVSVERINIFVTYQHIEHVRISMQIRGFQDLACDFIFCFYFILLLSWLTSDSKHSPNDTTLPRDKTKEILGHLSRYTSSQWVDRYSINVSMSEYWIGRILVTYHHHQGSYQCINFIWNTRSCLVTNYERFREERSVFMRNKYVLKAYHKDNPSGATDT